MSSFKPDYPKKEYPQNNVIKIEVNQNGLWILNIAIASALFGYATDVKALLIFSSCILLGGFMNYLRNLNNDKPN